MVRVPFLLATFLVWHSAEALFVKSLFVPLVTVHNRDDCPDIARLSVGGAVTNFTSVHPEFCVGANPVNLINTVPEIFLPEDQTNSFQIELIIGHTVFSGVFSINDTEGESEALERIDRTLTSWDGKKKISATVFARFVFTDLEFSDTALIVLSIVAASSIIILFTILIYLIVNRIVQRRLNYNPHAEGHFHNTTEDDVQPLIASSSENGDSVAVRERPSDHPRCRTDASLEASCESEIPLESEPESRREEENYRGCANFLTVHHLRVGDDDLFAIDRCEPILYCQLTSVPSRSSSPWKKFVFFACEEMKEMTSGCCVCAEENGWAGNPLVYCDGPGCDVAVHQGCYGIIEVPEGEWLCARCLAISSSSDISTIRCELCPYSTGALKRTADHKWTHVSCALYIPEVRFGNVYSMDPIIISDVPSERFSRPCYLCEEESPMRAKIGACMPCNRPGCRRVFHVTCGQKHGLLCELGNTPQTVNVKYCGYCTAHIKKAAQDPAVKIIGSGHQEAVGHTDLEPVTIPAKAPPVAAALEVATTTPLIKQTVKRSRINDVAGTGDVKVKKPRPSTKSSTNGRSFKSLLKLVGPVVSDTVSDFQRERVAAQHAAAANALQAHSVTQPSASSSHSAPPPVTANSNSVPVSLSSNSTTSNGFANNSKIKTENSSVSSINVLSNWDLMPHGPPGGSGSGVKNGGKTEVDRQHLMSQTPSTSASGAGLAALGFQQFPKTMEELLERQWEQGSAFLMGQSQFDVSQLMNCLNDLKMENSRLEDQMNQLQKRRDHLLALNTRLAQPLSCATASAAVSSPHHSPRASTGPPATAVTTTASSVTPVVTSASPPVSSVVSSAPAAPNAGALYTANHLLALNSRLAQPLSCASASEAVSSPHHSPRTSTAPTSATTTSASSVTPVVTSSNSSLSSVVSTAPPAAPSAAGVLYAPNDVTGGITSLSTPEDVAAPWQLAELFRIGMFIVGLTGGIACGKSTAAEVIRERGIQVVDSDAISREVVQPGERAYERLRTEFGDEFFDDENGGALRREKLGKLVFSDGEKRRKLNAITHPEIRKRILRQLLWHFIRGERFVVMDVPLFFEVGYDRLIGRVIVIDCGEETQLSRLIARDNSNPEDARARMNSQMPMSEKRKRATYLIDNNGSREDTVTQIHKAIDELEASPLPFVIRGVMLSVVVAIESEDGSACPQHNNVVPTLGKPALQQATPRQRHTSRPSTPSFHHWSPFRELLLGPKEEQNFADFRQFFPHIQPTAPIPSRRSRLDLNQKKCATAAFSSCLPDSNRLLPAVPTCDHVVARHSREDRFAESFSEDEYRPQLDISSEVQPNPSRLLNDESYSDLIYSPQIGPQQTLTNPRSGKIVFLTNSRSSKVSLPCTAKAAAPQPQPPSCPAKPPLDASTDYQSSLVPQMDTPTLRTPDFSGSPLSDSDQVQCNFGFTSEPQNAFNYFSSSYECAPQQLSYHNSLCRGPSSFSSGPAPAPSCSDDSAVDLSLLDDILVDESAFENLEFNADSWVDFLEGNDANGDLDRLLACDPVEPPPQPQPEALSPSCSGLDVSILNEFFDGFGSEQVAPQQQPPTVISSDYQQPFFDSNNYCSEAPMYIATTSSAAPSTSTPTTFADSSKTTAASPSSSSDQHNRESPSHYREMRDKNNLASQRSRQKRKLKFEELKKEAVVLEKRNCELRQLEQELESQLETYKKMMMTMISNK